MRRDLVNVQLKSRAVFGRSINCKIIICQRLGLHAIKAIAIAFRTNTNERIGAKGLSFARSIVVHLNTQDELRKMQNNEERQKNVLR